VRADTARTEVSGPPSREAHVRKLLVTTLAAIAAALALLVSSGLAAPDASQFCTALNDLGQQNHGQCVSLVQEVSYSQNGNKSGQGATDAVGFCKEVDAILKVVGSGGLKGIGFTFGQCVNAVK
jgi:hypothetical protein